MSPERLAVTVELVKHDRMWQTECKQINLHLSHTSPMILAGEVVATKSPSHCR